MSSTSTPRSTRSSSPGDEPNMLTPGRKIKAMMAKFDSDSESDNETTHPKNTIPKLDFASKNTTAAQLGEENPLSDESDESEEEQEIVRPKGRMASRMQGGNNQSEEKEDSAFARLSKSLKNERDQAKKVHETPVAEAESETNTYSSDDDMPMTAPRRKNNATQSQSPEPANDQSKRPAPRARSNSPLFVEEDDEDEAPEEGPDPSIKGNTRFLALVAKKRQEREEREKAEAEKKAARRAQMEKFSSDVVSGNESEDDPGSAQKLAQKARQPRKAGKKAMEEMRQETQRMSRNMQLAHQAQTKKKITKESFFARFNFGKPQTTTTEPTETKSSSTAGSRQSSDEEGVKNPRDTPHTSPVLGPTDSEKLATVASNLEQPESRENEETTAPTESVTAEATFPTEAEMKILEKTMNIPTRPAKKEPFQFTRPPVRVHLSRQEIARHQQDISDSDDDLDVVTSPGKARRVAAFENLPARKMQESASMIRLKALAHLTSPTRKSSSMSTAELSASLLYKARQQAAKERRERIEELRAQGVHIETAEERAAMEDETEDLVAMARQEADEIKRQERAARKNGQDPDDSEDDGDYELSGSEDEEERSGAEEENARSLIGNNGFLEQEADESSDDESEALPSDAEEEAPGTRRKRPTRVVSDDEDEEEAQQQVPSTPIRPPSNAAQSAERPHFPGMGSPSLSMGLTQAFAGTLADDQDGMSQPASATIPFSLPDPGRPVPRLHQEDSEILVRDSQEQPDEPDFMPNYRQNVVRVSESPAGPAFSQYSQLPDPTQDEGFVFSPFDPSKRFRGTPPVSTVDTVVVGQSQSPVAQRKNKQLRRGRAADLSVIEETEDTNEGDFEINPNAFNVMKKASKKAETPYDKKNSKAKNVVDEAAEESEDEYAGLGGNSDDEDDEENAYDKQMINDNSGETVDEKQLAALNAVHDRNKDEKDVAKLLKDITTGALRRRRGPDDEFDLDDSDDERLSRRRQKQREFAKMRKALLADDKVGELADNPKKAAFFKAIEDREFEDDFELEFLEENEGASQNEPSQDVGTEEQETGDDDSKKRKRPLEPSGEDATNRPPPNLRRTPASAMSKKPATLAEIRETLSFLTETPEYDSFHEDASLDEDELAIEEEEDADTSGADEAAHSDDANTQPKEDFAKPSHPRRTRGPVVDRLALLRKASSNSATGPSTGSGNTKLAFQTGNKNDGPIGFRPPPLLRRVTTGSSSSSSTSTTTNRVSKAAASGPKKGGAVNSYTAAREKERERQLRTKQRTGGSNVAKLLNKHAGGGLGALAGKGQWD
ncbi:hypothetical protein N7478_001849 [Penicillium angulare]|uniref:uncharacterized protein n=1 Tax=Penicillium angulare TaxID=116970 RepID=UPI0025418D97|nr:uncharacterized protein N7478_001849 [Penicillium angulare]KAJ5288819.1 hypothetical protein N7478_001849 [Penicillium angulare]